MGPRYFPLRGSPYEDTCPENFSFSEKELKGAGTHRKCFMWSHKFVHLTPCALHRTPYVADSYSRKTIRNKRMQWRKLAPCRRPARFEDDVAVPAIKKDITGPGQGGWGISKVDCNPVPRAKGVMER